MKIPLCAIVICAWLSAALVVAGPFEPTAVPQGSSWVAHIDFDRLRTTEIGKRLIAGTSRGQAAARMQVIQNLFQMDPRTDFHSMTLSGHGQGEENAVLVLRADFDRAALTALLEAGPAYQEVPHHNWTLYRFQDERKQKMAWGAFLDDRTIVCGQSQERVGECLETLAGARPAAADALWAAVPDRGALFAATADLAHMGELDAQAAILRQAESLALSVDESDGLLKVRVALSADSPEVATQLNQVAQGLIAMGSLAAAKDPAKAWVPGFCQGIRVTQDGRSVQVSADYPVKDAVELIDAREKARGLEGTMGTK